MRENYSTVQKLSLAGIFIGSVLCAVGGLAPYWIVSDPDAPGSWSAFVNIASQVITAYMGPYMYCAEFLGEKQCELFETNAEDDGWFHSVRVTGIVCIGLGGICGLSSLCLACCTCCRRFIALGILAAFAAGCGGFAAGVYAQKMEIFTMKLGGFSFGAFGWAFYVFCSGVGVMGLSSLAACFSSPEQTVHPGTIGTQPMQPIIITTSQQQQQQQFAAGQPQYASGQPQYASGHTFYAPAPGQPQYGPSQPQYAPSQPQYAPGQPNYAPWQSHSQYAAKPPQSAPGHPEALPGQPQYADPGKAQVDITDLE